MFEDRGFNQVYPVGAADQPEVPAGCGLDDTGFRRGKNRQWGKHLRFERERKIRIDTSRPRRFEKICELKHIRILSGGDFLFDQQTTLYSSISAIRETDATAFRLVSKSDQELPDQTPGRSQR